MGGAQLPSFHYPQLSPVSSHTAEDEGARSPYSPVSRLYLREDRVDSGLYSMELCR